SLGTGSLNIMNSTVKNTDSVSHTYTHTQINLRDATFGGPGSADMVFVSTTSGGISDSITVNNNGSTPVTVTYSGPLGTSLVPPIIKLGSGTLVLTGSEPNSVLTSAVVREGTLVLNKPTGTQAIGSVGVLAAAGTGRVLWQADEQVGHDGFPGLLLCENGVLDLNGHTEKQNAIRFATDYTTGMRMNPASGAGSITTGTQGKLTMVPRPLSGEAEIILGSSATATARISGNLELAVPTVFNISNGAQPVDMLVDAALSGPGDLKKTGDGILQLTGPNTSTGKIIVNAGTLVLDAEALPTGLIDLNSRLVVRGDRFSRDALTDYITQCLQSTDRLTSSSAAADSKHLTGLAVIPNFDNAGDPLFSQFGGLSVTANDILLMCTWHGDVNLDGKVNLADYFLVDAGFITQKGGYRNGDLNYDGKVDLADYFLIDSSFIGQTTGVAVASTPVPEPATLLPLLGSLLLARRRRL
ncbi:MAG TPA: autotransporter-associated beta strand repeat-containing protein, partial [Tepidisphaeraceae bacterium]|nr:autotransporter-associated beta strand repeat-containing protein [Tepidisphaeraceae bacterium]